ncbi:MAG: NifB/NifX family molybdenum-iron cluster-binding protein [Deferribacterales bacterium]
MKILFPTGDNAGLESSVYKDFADAPTFLWFDTETGGHGFADNDGCGEDDGGKSAVLSASETGVETVIVKEIGCAAVNRLRGHRIDAYASKGGTISEDIELFKANALRRIFAGECDGSCKV